MSCEDVPLAPFPSPKPEWVSTQRKIALQVQQTNPPHWPPLGSTPVENFPIKYVAGLDISYEKNSTRACVALVILTYKDLQVVYEDTQIVTMTEDYVPNFLSFREKPILVAQVEKLKTLHPELFPDLFLVDGNGVLHRDRAGLACQFGVHFDVPTIGVAKNEFFPDGVKKKHVFQSCTQGNVSYIRDENGALLGAAVLTRDNVRKPMYVSVGHRVSLETAVALVLRFCVEARQPQPTRLADIASRKALAEFISPKKQSNKHKN